MSGIKTLEVGAGSGSDSIYLAKKGTDTSLVDFSSHSIAVSQKIAKANHVKVHTYQADCRHLPFKSQTFDLVFSVGLVEHFSNPIPVLKEQLRVLRNGGILIIDVPQKFNPYTLVKKLRMLTGTYPFGWETEYSLFDLKRLARKLKIAPLKFYGRNSSLTLKLHPKLQPHYSKIFAIIESSPIAPFLCLCIGGIFKKIHVRKSFCRDACQKRNHIL